nr:DUF2332 family protein [Natronococcus sp. AD5]
MYATPAEAAADDRRMRDIAAEASTGQPEPQLLLAAVRSLLLRGRDHPLAQFYPPARETTPVKIPSLVSGTSVWRTRRGCDP